MHNGTPTPPQIHSAIFTAKMPVSKTVDGRFKAKQTNTHTRTPFFFTAVGEEKKAIVLKCTFFLLFCRMTKTYTPSVSA